MLSIYMSSRMFKYYLVLFNAQLLILTKHISVNLHCFIYLITIIFRKEEHTTAWNRFVSSVRSRLAVAQVVENVKSNATLNFDFIALLMIATLVS